MAILDVHHLHFSDVNVIVGLVHIVRYTLNVEVEILLLNFFNFIAGSRKAPQATMQ